MKKENPKVDVSPLLEKFPALPLYKKVLALKLIEAL